MDLVAVNGNSVWVVTSDPTHNRFLAPVLGSSSTFHGTRTTVLADVSGDGRADLIAINDSSQWVMIATGGVSPLVRKLGRADLLCIDDVGMRKLPATAAEDLLEVVTRRYEVGATIFTSNRPWKTGELFSVHARPATKSFSHGLAIASNEPPVATI